MTSEGTPVSATCTENFHSILSSQGALGGKDTPVEQDLRSSQDGKDLSPAPRSQHSRFRCWRMIKSKVYLSLATRAPDTWEKLLVEVGSIFWLLDGATQPPTFSTRPGKCEVTNTNKEMCHQA